MHYTVQHGDTLWLIAQRFRQDLKTLAMVNSILEPFPVFEGQVLHIPRRHRVIGFVPDYAGAEGIADALGATDPLNEVIYTFLRVQPDGSLAVGACDPAVQLLRSRRTRVLAGVSNQPESTYSADAADAVLLAGDSRSTLAAEIVDAAVANALDGAHMDFQRIDTAHWDAEVQLLCEIRSRFSQISPYYTLTVSIPSDWQDKPFDLRRMAGCVDFMILEGYEKGSTDPEGPPTPLSWLERTVASAVAEIGTAKLAVALGAYGLDWASGHASYITVDAAQRTAYESGARIERDRDGATPGFVYEDSTGVPHQVWYEDLASLAIKTRLLDSVGISKVALWRLGSIPPEVVNSVCDPSMLA